MKKNNEKKIPCAHLMHVDLRHADLRQPDFGGVKAKKNKYLAQKGKVINELCKDNTSLQQRLTLICTVEVLVSNINKAMINAIKNSMIETSFCKYEITNRNFNCIDIDVEFEHEDDVEYLNIKYRNIDGNTFITSSINCNDDEQDWIDDVHRFEQICIEIINRNKGYRECTTK